MSNYLLDILPLAAKGYCCSQILGLLALEGQGEANAGLVRALGGLCHGMGQCGLTCGVLTGGACVLSFYVGKGTEGETALNKADLLLSEYVEWFRDRTARYGGISCADILGECSQDKPDMSRCAALIGDAWGRILTLLDEAGIDPAQPRQ